MTNRFKTKNTVILKIVFILFMILLLMIPNMMIRDLIRERSGRKSQIEREVAKSYGQEQNVIAPILCVPYVKKITDKDGGISTRKGNLYFSPNNVDINGHLNTKTRKRSIYEVVVYDSELAINSDITIPTELEPYYDDVTLDLAHAYLNIGISDPNGLSDASKISINGKSYKLDGISTIPNSSLKFVKTTPFNVEIGKTMNIKTDLIFKGTRSLKLEPIGESMTVNLTSPWKDPSFVGTKLPADYDITEAGFTANWVTNKYAHDYQKYWTSRASTTQRQQNSFGVNLIQPVDEYGKNSRTAKYALLIIALTFGIFFFFEILFKNLIHPIQYALIGFALTVFYLLLLSITEHIGFDLAYLISSVATIGLIVFYASSILKDRKQTGILALLLSGLFAYIFVILQMQDFALLAGALALFVVLALVMYLSRKVNWYDLAKADETSTI